MSDDTSIEIKRRVHLGRKLGEGGMGIVLDGFDSDLGQYLAIKILHPDKAGDPDVRARFEEEAAIMASIDHPGNLPVYGVAKDSEGHLCYVMKKVEGRTLADLISERGSRVTNLPARQRLISFLLDACETLACAHELGIVHRDVKPDNILVDRHGSVFVIDWGLARRGEPGTAKSTETRTIPGLVMGSPGYLSPEQAEGKSASAGPPTDVFGLGAILYEILTGKRPFESDDRRVEMLGSIHHDPEHPRKSNLLLPRSIAGVCMKALHKDPKQRYRNAGEMAADLRAFLEGRPVAAVKPNFREKIYYASRSNPVRVLVVGTVILACFITALFIAAQVLIDQRLADKAYDQLATLDGDLRELVEEGDVARARLRSENMTQQQRARLEAELSRIDSRWALGELEAMRLLSSVDSLRFIRADPDLQTAARERLFNVIESANERENPALADAVVETALERQAEGTAVLKLSEADLIRLNQEGRKARRLLGLPEDEHAPDP